MTPKSGIDIDYMEIVVATIDMYTPDEKPSITRYADIDRFVDEARECGGHMEDVADWVTESPERDLSIHTADGLYEIYRKRPFPPLKYAEQRKG